MVNLGAFIDQLPQNTLQRINSIDPARKEVAEVMVMASPDIKNWIIDQELILTSFFGLNVQQQQALLIQLSQHHAAGVIVKKTPYLSQIDSQIITTSERVNLPLIQINNLKYRDVINSFNQLQDEQLHQKLRLINAKWEHTMKEVFHDNLTGPEEQWLHEQMDSDHDTQFRLISVMNQLSSTEIQTILNELNGSGFKFGICLILDKCYLLIKDHDLTSFVKLVDHRLHQFKFICGQISPIDKMSHGYWQVNNIRKLSLIEHQAGQLLRFEQLGFYKLFVNFPTNELTQTLLTASFDRFAHSESELFDSLVAYLESNFNVSKAAQRLFIHPKSLRYRLHKIEKMLAVDLKDPNNLLTLNLSVKFLTLVEKGFYVS